MTPNDIMAFRVRHDLTQRGAAALVGVDLRTWQKWEYGERAITPLVIRFLFVLDTVPAAKKALAKLAPR